MFLKKLIKKILRIIKFDKLVYCLKIKLYTKKIEMSYEDAYIKLNTFFPMPSSTPFANNIIVKPMYDLTIIIPAYNVEKWICECLNSAFNQKTNYKYNVVVINDGSTDNTLEYINKYSSKDNIVIINQENKGYSGARNVALKQLNSKYIMFLDSDDYITENAVQLLLNKAFEYDADIVEGSAKAFGESGVIYTVKHAHTVNDTTNLWGGPCFKIFKSKLFEHVIFPINYLYEDTIISYLLIPIARTVITIPDIVYQYRIHSNSITQLHTNNPNRVSSFWIMLLVHECMPRYNLSVRYQTYKLTMRHIVFTYRRTIMLDEDIKKCIFILTRQFLMDYYRDIVENDEFYTLFQSLMNYEFDRYCLICKYINV